MTRIFLILTAILAPALALAQEAAESPGFVIDLSGILEPLIALAVAVLTALLGLLSRYINQKTGLDLDLKHNTILDSAIKRAAEFAYNEARARGVLHTRSQLVAAAAGYVVAGAPKALTYFKVTPERLAEMIEARLWPDIELDAAGVGPPGVSQEDPAVPAAGGS